MHDLQYQKVLDLQQQNWWYRGRRDLFRKVINTLPNRQSALEIGCGMGANLQVLKESFKSVQGIEDYLPAVKYCQSQKFNVKKGSAERLPFKANTFDFILCADVLEHLKDDKKAVEEIKRVLKPRGELLLTVPAHKYLWTVNDEMSKHERRYEKKQIRELLKNELIIRRISYWNRISFLPNLLVSTFKKKQKEENNLEMVPSWANNLLYKIIKRENKKVMKKGLIQGVSIVCLARKV